MGNPTFRYRRGKDGEIEAQIFDSDDLPKEGWVDSPARVDSEIQKEKKEPVKFGILKKKRKKRGS